MTQGHSSSPSGRPIVVAIAVTILLYAGACMMDWPQHGTELMLEAKHKHAEHEGDKNQSSKAPPIVWVTPFALLLLCIAVLPLLPQTEHWWESNRNRFTVGAALGLLTLIYFLLWHGKPVEAHWPAHDIVHPQADTNLQWALAWTVLTNAILYEYVPFIVLLFSLYVISGGIRIEGNLTARPLTNCAFFAVGGSLASFIGTTGAAMLLIRPLLETNGERHYKVHTVVFFIFIVCNCGGLLLPIGDPPLFLGYLRGVDFLWTMTLWQPWLFVNGALLLAYWVWDQFFMYPRETMRDRRTDQQRIHRLTCTGWIVNVPLLVGVVLSVALLDPGKTFPGTDWHSPLFLREVIQLGLVAISLWLGDAQIRHKNHFNYHAILEVAALFFGIFLCMQPALQILNERGPEMGIDQPWEFFWLTGSLSTILDNAPTYVVFFETAKTLTPGGAEIPGTVIKESFLVAISLGAVFMGALTYIGNGPNFMVKAIAETSGVRMPSFFGYLKYSVIPLLVFLAATWIFLF